MLHILQKFFEQRSTSKNMFWKRIIILKKPLRKIYCIIRYFYVEKLGILYYTHHLSKKVQNFLNKSETEDPQRRYYLSALAVFKNESPWLKEWIEYHRFLGVEHFYLYNNDDDTTESDKILAPYVKRGIIENIHFPGKMQQIPAYRDGIQRARGNTEWLCIMDIDEFIYPIKEDTISSVLKDYEDYSGLVINWQIFGSSSLQKRPQNQINHFLHRAQTDHSTNQHVKSIVRPDFVNFERVCNPHTFPYITGFSVDENRKIVSGAFNPVTVDTIQINHYIVRSYQDFVEVKMPKGSATSIKQKTLEYFEAYDRNEIFDDRISQRFGKKLFRP